jgi:hypothetical protein
VSAVKWHFSKACPWGARAARVRVGNEVQFVLDQARGLDLQGSRNDVSIGERLGRTLSDTRD